MLTQEDRAAFFTQIEPFGYRPSGKTLQHYAHRRPMDRLPDRYRGTNANPDQLPLVHFAIPVDEVNLYKYADKHDLMVPYPLFPHLVCPASLLLATKRLSEEVQYDLKLEWPFELTADCGLILALYDNFTMDDKMLVEEDEEDVIQLVQEELGLDKSVRPKWYFDAHEPWSPRDSDEGN